ncbi:APC family permease [Nocardia wallacei]|uniref:APC family permease n=1 Tax=Nocardia wallacei TaxID=480035 RepID=UPI002455213F|nr:amino acid permease [Nocardia wallacei]
MLPKEDVRAGRPRIDGTAGRGPAAGLMIRRFARSRGRVHAPPSGVIRDRRLRRHHRGDAYRLTAVGGLAALSLDALSSVAYGPEAIVAVLVTAGADAVGYTVPVTIALTVLLLVLVTSYRQVIAVFPDGGGSYAVARRELGRPASLLAAAALVVDYVLTVAVGLAAGAAALGSMFPVIADHLLVTALIALAVLTALNLAGIAESAKALLGPAALFLVVIGAIIVVGLLRDEPVATIGTALTFHELPGVIGPLLLVKAFAAGGSALTGVEATANGVPEFRTPAVRRAQHTEMALGLLLGAMLLGIAAVVATHRVVPRDGVTLLAQLAAAAFGTGLLFYVANLAIAGALGLAANTSFGGLPVLLSRLAHDHRMPHLFALRAERPVYRFGVATLGVLAALVLLLVDARVDRLLPLYAIGVFIGFTISQVGLVRHWRDSHGRWWRAKLWLNGFGALLTAAAAVVFLLDRFAEGAWLLLFLVPGLMLLFDRTEHYYRQVAAELRMGTTIPVPRRDPTRRTVVVVPVVAVSDLTRRALDAALSLGEQVHPIAVDIDPETTRRLVAHWEDWDPGLELRVLPSPHCGMVEPIVEYARTLTATERQVLVLLPRLEPRRRRYRILHNQRAPIIAEALDRHTDAIAATITLHLD